MMLSSRPTFVVWILLSCGVLAFGQAPPGPPGMRPPGGGGPSFNHGPPGPPPLMMLATQKSVQSDLKLDPAQKQRIQALDAKLRKTMFEHGPPPPDSFAGGARPEPPNSSDKAPRSEPPNDSAGGARPEPPDHSAGGARPEPPGKGMEKELAGILSEKQLARLKQIALQFEGPRALLAPERTSELELTEEQRGKIARMTRKDQKAVMAILNEEQRAKWQEMIGRPFRGKIAFPSPRMPMPGN